MEAQLQVTAVQENAFVVPTYGGNHVVKIHVWSDYFRSRLDYIVDAERYGPMPKVNARQGFYIQTPHF